MRAEIGAMAIVIAFFMNMTLVMFGNLMGEIMIFGLIGIIIQVWVLLIILRIDNSDRRERK